MGTIEVFHLYPEQLNLFGDRANILALQKRAQWRGLNLKVTAIKLHESLDFRTCDLLVAGGGPEVSAGPVLENLKAHREELGWAVEKGLPVLATGSAFQMLGHSYTNLVGTKLEGLSLFDLHTRAGPERLKGQIIIRSFLWEEPKTIVGFENHAGRSYLNPGAKPLGTVLKGFGNNGQDLTEGALYKNMIGTYLHGALLPRNPWLADYLLQKALQYRHQDVFLKELDDTEELNAHRAALRAARIK